MFANSLQRFYQNLTLQKISYLVFVVYILFFLFDVRKRAIHITYKFVNVNSIDNNLYVNKCTNF